MSYMASLPSNRPGFAGLIGRVESIAETMEVNGCDVRTPSGILIYFADISLPVLDCVNPHGIGPNTLRPWMGSPNLNEQKETHEQVQKVVADLTLAVEQYPLDQKLLTLALGNFRRHNSGRPVTVGRPITSSTNFGADAISEAYTSLTVRAFMRGEDHHLGYGIDAETPDGDVFQLPVNSRAREVVLHPAYLLGSTCLLAADRRAGKDIGCDRAA